MIQAENRTGPAAGLRARILLFLLWLALAAFLASRHVVWRDEVRALTFALQGDSVGEMLSHLREGHPALWYLLLRGFHMLWPHPQVLVVLGFAVGVASALIFAMRAPFGWAVLALGLFGRFALYEYTVVARNYGISMAILYAFAWAYPRHRNAGWLPGLLLLLLCNTDFPSVPLAGALLLFWAIDLYGEAPGRWDRRWIGWGIGASLSLTGVMLCFLTIYPPLFDAAPVAAPKHGWPLGGLVAVVRTGHFYNQLVPAEVKDGATVMVPPLLFGILWQWRDNRGAWIAGLVGMSGLLTIFAFLYNGDYRHQALLLPFLLTIAWLRAKGFGGAQVPKPGAFAATIEPYTKIAFCGLLALQVASSIPFVTRAIRHMPESRSADLARLLRKPELLDAIVIGDPDYLLEPLPYYVANPTYLVREQRWGRYALFTKKAKHAITPDLILDTARRLHAQTGKPIVILMSEHSYREGAPSDNERGTYGNFTLTWDSLQRFKAATRQLASFDHITGGDETYDVLLYDGAPKP